MMRRSPSSLARRASGAAGVLGAWLLGAACVAITPQVAAQTSPASQATRTSPSQQLSPQERLDAIRLSLVEASLQTPTKVQSTTWMDHRGVMHEASSFKNGLQVQGVRVMGFERDEQGVPKAWLKMPEASATPHKVATKTEAKEPPPAADPLCPGKAAGQKLRHVVQFALQLPGDTHPLVAQWLPGVLQEQWLSPQAQPQTQAWRLVPELSRPLLARENSAYERLLLSSLPSEMPWKVTLKVFARTTSDGYSPWGRTTPKEIELRMNLSMSPADQRRATLEDEVTLILDMALQEWQRPVLTASSQAAVLSQLRAWQNTLNTWLMCETVQPAVTTAQQQQLKINAGALAGVQRGDEWLIADPARFPQQLVAKEGAPQTLLARVDAVSPHEAMLTVLAGPTRAVQPNWRAWPVQTLVQETALMAATSPMAPLKK